MIRLQRKQWLTLLSVFIITPIGFFSKFYQGAGEFWVNNSLGGVFYEIFWCLVIFLLFPNIRTVFIATTVFIMTGMLEFLQLWHPYFLEILRSSFIGKTILGTSFAWSDFPYYLIGSFIGWIWIRYLNNRSN